ncbi:MAG: pyridoxamine 5'-phosphate oxidase family protein, partial [Bellilinea sp.]
QEARQHLCPETLLIVVPAAQGVLTLAQVESRQTVRSAYPVGEALPAGSAAEDLFQSPPAASIIRNGYSLRLSNEIIELALPVCPDGVHPQAALLLSAPSFRWTEQTLVQQWLMELRALAARLSYRLGATFYAPYQVQPPGQLPAEAQLNPQEIRRFLQGPWTARLACLRPDGKPHVIPVWQEWDGKAFYLIAWRGSLWAEYLLSNPEASLTIDEPWPPLRRVSARGKALPLPLAKDDPRLNELLRRLSERYLGEAALAPSGDQIQQVFQIIPESVRGWKGLLTAHSPKGEVSIP